MDTDDYTQSVGQVMAKERVYAHPLSAHDLEEVWSEWVRLNPEAMRSMEYAAIAIDMRGMRVSAKYLVERERYEGRAKLVPVPYTDQDGVEHHYAFNNDLTPLLARWLLERHPSMRIKTCRSRFDRSKHEQHVRR